MATWEKIEDIEVWKEAQIVSKKIWELIESTPLANDFKLKDQMSGSSGSIMDNIAEGFGRGGNKEFKNFLTYSTGSCAELRSQLYRCFDRRHIDQATFDRLNNDVLILSRRIKSLINYLKDTPYKGTKFKEPTKEYITKPKPKTLNPKP